MTNSDSTDGGPSDSAPTIREALHTTLDVPFEDAVPHVQLEHELAGFETVAVSRVDRMIEGVLKESVPRTALLVVCHADIAKQAIEIDQTLAAMLPCVTGVYEDDEGTVHVHHLSTTKAIRDLGAAPGDPAAVEALVEMTGELMTEVWENVERHAPERGNDE
ncbi:MAG: DUF302 domain-containing protein [archaeon]